MHYQLSPEDYKKLYTAMLWPRLIEEKMLVYLRQGKISKWFSGIGQEAIAVGVTLALQEDEYILPMHRNLGVFTSRNIPLVNLFAQWQGKLAGFTKGRDRSFHFGTNAHHIVGMISHLGPQLGIANGIALSHVLRQEQKITAVFTGEGATSEGDFHEALNVASVWQLPVLFCIENNGYGLSTPTNEQYNCKHLAYRGIAYGMESHVIDGNDIVQVYSKIRDLAQSMRETPRPVLIEFKTFRRRGHEEASGTKYVPEDLMRYWEEKDPVTNFEAMLLKNKYISEAEKNQLYAHINDEITTTFKEASALPAVTFNLDEELNDVYAPVNQFIPEAHSTTKKIRFIDAIAEGLQQAMQQHPEMVIMGQDVADYGGVFKITEGFVAQFGKERVRNTPICESIIVSTAMGLAIKNIKSVVEMQFADFVSSGFNPIVNLLAKSYYRWGQPADVVVRMPCGGGVGAGPFHSQTNEAWFTKVPGLKVVYPAFPEDAKQLLIAAIEDPNPVLFFEHKALYRTIEGEVSTNYQPMPLGKAKILQEGKDITVITFGAAVHWALETVKNHPEISVDLLDLRCLQPLDVDAICASVQKTGKVIILQEDSMFGGIASEISAIISEKCFEYLDAPVKRVASLDTPIPFAKNLEEQYLGKSRFETAFLELYNY